MEKVWCIVLDKRLRKSFIFSGLACLFMTSYPMSIHAQEISQESIQQLEHEISQKLNVANEKYRQVERLKQDLNELKSNQKELEFQINEQQEKLAEKELLDHWMPVDLYVGGPEHAVGHLLYSRMWTKFLHEEGLLSIDEPYKKLFHQGMMLGANGIKMGKRYKEFVVNPNDIVEEYGADALRLYQMFMGPLEASKPWSDSGIMGAKKFLDKVVRLLTSDKIQDKDNSRLDKVYNYTIKKCEEDYEKLSFNTAIAQMMIFINEISKEDIIPLKYIKGFLKLLNPICPYLTEEFYQRFFNVDTITYEKFPVCDESKLEDDFKTIGVQVNGKLRGTLVTKLDSTENEVFEKALQISNVSQFIEGKEIVKKILVKNKLLNIVVK